MWLQFSQYLLIFIYLFGCTGSQLCHVGSSSLTRDQTLAPTGARSLSHWTAREVLGASILMEKPIYFHFLHKFCITVAFQTNLIQYPFKDNRFFFSLSTDYRQLRGCLFLSIKIECSHNSEKNVVEALLTCRLFSLVEWETCL